MNQLTVCFFFIAISYATGFKRYVNPEEFNGTRPSPIYIDELDEYREGNIATDGSRSTLFYLYNKNHSFKLRRSEDIFHVKTYNPKKQNVFVVHGWKNDKNSALFKTLVPVLLQNNDVNVFVVDWSHKSKRFYSSSRRAVNEIGKDVAKFINTMMGTYDLGGDDFILIGHSLGAHVCGIAGQNIYDKVGYIVGLDPAHPLFQLSKPDTYLEHSDAKFVEIIHTNGAKLGIQSAIGHADYYPNGGNDQPGCEFLQDLTGSCSHARAYEYYAESLVNKEFTSVLCESYAMYLQGDCKESLRSKMGGLQPDMSEGDFYLNTNSAAPYCQGRRTYGLKQGAMWPKVKFSNASTICAHNFYKIVILLFTFFLIKMHLI